MSLFQKVRVTVLAYTHELLDKTIDMNSIPVVKQYIRDVEDALAKMRHEAAAAAALVTTLTRNRDTVQGQINADTARAKAFLAKSDEKNARIVAGRIHDQQQEVTSLNEQIKTAEANAQSLDGAVEMLDTKHREMVSRVRQLEQKVRTAGAMESATAGLRQAAELTSGVDAGASVDNLSQRIDARADVAREEFNRTVGEFQPAEDPVKDAAVDDILAGLREPVAAEK